LPVEKICERGVLALEKTGRKPREDAGTGGPKKEQASLTAHG